MTQTKTAGARAWLGLVVLVLVVMLLAIDGTVLYLAVPSLTEDLGPSAEQVLWIGEIYAFVLAGLLITMGNVADKIGRKRLVQIGTVAFRLASVLAAFAPSAGALIAARALLGVAGATLIPSTLSMVRSMFTDAKQRARAIALWSAGAGGGAALGPVVGGVLLEHYWWGSVFLINVPVMVLALVAGWFLLPESRGKAPKRIDFASSLLSILMIVPIVYAVKRFANHGFEVLAVVGVVAVALVGVLLARLGAGRSISLGLGVSAIGLAIIALATDWDGYLGLGIGLVIVGLGIGVAMTLSVAPSWGPFRLNARGPLRPFRRLGTSSVARLASQCSVRYTRRFIAASSICLAMCLTRIGRWPKNRLHHPRGAGDAAHGTVFCPHVG